MPPPKDPKRIPPSPLNYHNPAAEREARRRWRRHRLAMATERLGGVLTWIVIIAIILIYLGTRLGRIFVH